MIGTVAETSAEEEIAVEVAVELEITRILIAGVLVVELETSVDVETDSVEDVLGVVITM